MRILMVGSEMTPFAKTGGLADVLGALPLALARLGHEVEVVIPRYREVTAGDLVGRITVRLGGQQLEAGVWAASQGGVRTVFIDQPRYFDRKGLYGESGQDYDDNAERFAFLGHAAVRWTALTGARYDVVHGHDWQAGALAALVRHPPAPHPLAHAPLVFTIHNLAYQGLFDPALLPGLGLGDGLMTVDGMEYWRQASYLKAGLMFSDVVTTVSPRYAQEIQTAEYGCGFDGVLRARREHLVGILNGIDYDQWDPARDSFLPASFGADDLSGKTRVKRAALEAFGIHVDDVVMRRPLVGMVSRLVDQKGFDLLADLPSRLHEVDATFVLLGTGDARYETLWRDLAAANPDRVGAHIGFDERLAHVIEGGSDIFLMPSRFEPCGLNQMYSLRYGTVPVVRATGGLADTVRNYDPVTGEGTGFTFDDYSVDALIGTLRWAVEVFGNPQVWRRIQFAGMRDDHSWDGAAREYVSVYERAGRMAGARRSGKGEGRRTEWHLTR
jgi:starch synthase